jgi:Zn-dependent alcohol dehydrogenase
MDGKIDRSDDHRHDAAQINKGFDLMRADESIRSMVVY